MTINKPIRQFVAQDLKIENWDSIAVYFKDLVERNINSIEDFKIWLRDNSELEAIIEEDAAWRYIKMTINTKDETLSKAYKLFVSDIQPQIAPFEDTINRKLNSIEFTKELESDPAYHILFRGVRKALELYRKENIQLISEVATESQKFGYLSAAQSIDHDGEILTIQKASSLLKETDEDLRETVLTRFQQDVVKILIHLTNCLTHS